MIFEEKTIILKDGRTAILKSPCVEDAEKLLNYIKKSCIVNAVQHYLHCPETPEIPQPAPVDIHTIEDIVRRIVEEQKKPALKNQEPVKAQSSGPQTVNFYDDDSEEQLGEEGLTAIAHTIAAFRKG